MMSDLISRQAAMVVFENSGLDDDSKDTVVRVLEQLPSAQPEITEDDVKEYCRKRCLIVVSSDFYDEMTRRWASAQPKQYWIDSEGKISALPSGQIATDKNVGDTISRQQAIDIVRNRVKRFTTACVLAVTEIEKLPSAQPELLEHEAYIRGFEQGRTQGMIDAKERKK